MKKIVLAALGLAFLSSPVLADSVRVQMGLSGKYGGNGG